LSNRMNESGEMDVDKKRPARGSRNKKRNWRNKIDLSNVEADLEKKRFEEVHFGGSLKDQKDEDLFSIDKGQQKAKKSKKVPYVERILQNKSKVEPPLAVEPRTVPTKSKRHDENKLKHRLKTVQLQSEAAKNRKTVEETRKEQTSLNNTYDLWGSAPPTTSKFSPAEHAKVIDGRARVKRPSRMKYKPDMAGKVNALIPSHAGASYNPDFDAHQALLREEIKKTEEEKKVRNKYFEKSKPAPIGERVTAEDIVKESMQGLGILGDSDEEFETDEEEQKEPIVKPVIRAENRKSKKQRLKEQKVLKEQTKARRRKKLRILMNQIYEVKRIKRELREHDEALEQRRQYRRQKKETRMPRLGRVKYQKPDQDLKLTTELTGTLRQLVPEGDVLSDRHESFMARTMMEPRNRLGKQKLKFRPKWQQKRSFREFDEKFEAELKKDEKMET